MMDLFSLLLRGSGCLVVSGSLHMYIYIYNTHIYIYIICLQKSTSCIVELDMQYGNLDSWCTYKSHK